MSKTKHHRERMMFVSVYLKRVIVVICVLTLLVSAVSMSGSAQSAFVVKSGVLLSLGENSLILDTSAVTTIYKFTPTEVGVYTFSASDPNALVGYWGAGSFYVSDQTADKTSTLDVTLKNVGPSIMVGISGVETCTLTITHKAEENVVIEPEWVQYQNVAEVTKFTVPTTVTLTPVNVTNSVINKAVMGSDGYYHLDKADGPLLIADLGHATMSLKAMQSYGQIRRYYYDEDGNVIQKLNFYNAMEEYFAAADGTMYPVTEDIRKVLVDMGEFKGWYDPDVLGGFYMFEGYTVDPDEAWMFVCYSMRECPIAHIEAVAPGCHYSGNVEYWYCSKCGDYWTDAACTMVSNSKSVILPALGTENLIHVEAAEPACHQFGNIEYWYCPDCDNYFQDEACTQITNRLNVRLAAENELTYVSEIPATYASEGMSEYWYCAECDAVFSDAAGTQLTNRKNLTIPMLSGVRIIAQPTSTHAAPGEIVAFQVEAEGNELTYKWQYSKNGNAWYASSNSFVGYNNATMFVPVTAARNGFRYRCVVSSTDGTVVITEPAILMLTESLLQITKHPQAQTVFTGNNAVFSITAAGESVQYRWQYSINGNTWYTSSFNGNNTAAMTVPATLARNGFFYRCIVTDAAGNKLVSSAAALTVQESTTITITVQPQDILIAAGENAVFTVTVNGMNLVYRWQYSKNGNAWYTCTTFDGRSTATLTVPATNARNGFYYRCVITDENGFQVTTDAAQLNID